MLKFIECVTYFCIYIQLSMIIPTPFIVVYKRTDQTLYTTRLQITFFPRGFNNKRLFITQMTLNLRKILYDQLQEKKWPHD